MTNIFITFIGSIALIYISLWIKSSRLKIVNKPFNMWITEDLFSQLIILEITNLGYDNCTIDDIKLEFKNGSQSIFIDDQLLHQRLVTVIKKETVTMQVNCYDLIKNRCIDFSLFKVYRCVVITTSNKVYKSNWGTVNDLIDTWKTKK